MYNSQYQTSFSRIVYKMALTNKKDRFCLPPITVEMSISRVIPSGTPSSVESEKAGRGGEGKTANVFALLV